MDNATKTPPTPRATDRVLQALSTLAALIDRSIKEVQALDSEFQNRLLQAVQETEASVQSQAAQQFETALTDARTKLEEQFTKKIAEITAQWEDDRNRLSGDLSNMSQTAAQWEAERTRLNSEVERLVRVQAETQAEAEKAILALKSATAAAKSAKEGASINSEALNMEIQRVEGLVKEISTLIDNPTTELSTVIRKNVERAELESYLRGIRFALKS